MRHILRRLGCDRVLTAALAATLVVAPASSAADRGGLTLISPDFRDGGPIPGRLAYNRDGCTGGDLSPAIEWRGAPPGTKSFALTVFDIDEKSTGSGWWHWVVYDLPPTTTRLTRGAGVANGPAIPRPAAQGRTDLGTDAYHGPCPDPGPPHRYVIAIYALSVAKLDVPPEPSGAMVTATLRPVTLASATLTGLYKR